MTDQKPREFWIREPTEPRKGSCIVATEVKPPWEDQAPQSSSHWLKKPAFKVIEKSAFDSVVKELAEQIKVNLAGQERELKLMHEVEKLRAENELLDLKLNAYISGVDQLNNIWLEHGCEKSSSTCLACKAHNAVHGRIDKSLRGADEKD